MTRDNDSIAEWISVSVNDLPLPNVSGAYGNGGAGHFSNEKQQQGKKQKKNKPWKLGRFAASEVVLPPKVTSTSSVVPSKRRSASFVKRSPSEEVNAAPRTSRESTTSPNKGPFMRNLGFTTANRNVILQNLCAERSISALAASTIHIAGNGRIHVPQPSPLPARKTKAKLKATKQKNQMQSSQEPPTVPVVAASSESHRPSHNAEKSQDAYLNASKDHRMGYNLSNAAGGTVKSMAPELGDWSGSSRHELGSSEEVMVEEERPFRDYEDEGSDLFDSDRSESVSDSESEEEMDYDEEDAEVPVRFGQRVNLSNRAGSGFYSAQTQTQTQIVEQLPTTVKAAPDEAPRSGNANDSKIVPSTSFERLAPGTVMLHGNDLRICVEDGEVSSRTARPLAFWKAVEVQQPQTPAPTENQIRRQPSSKAMKLEQEVATGIFAAFVGNRSPRRQAQRSSVDLSSKADQSSSEKRSASTFDARELLVSKVNKSTFSVRSETRTTSAGTEQVIEIIRRHAPRGASHTTQPSESSRASVPSHRLERAFPSPLHSSHDLTHDRSRSNRTDASLATLEDAAERTRIHIQQKVGRGFTARFQNREGQQWTWQGSKVEASVLSPRKDSSGNSALDMLEGYDLNLHTVDGSQTIELATYTADSQVRNALGLFKPRTKSVPKPLPEDVSSIGAPVLPPAQVVPLAIPVRGGAGGVGRGEPQIPLRGIRGGPLLRSQPTAAGSAARGHGLWQHQRAVVSNEAVVQVHNNAVQNVRASLLLHGGGTNAETGSTPISRDTAGSPTEETAGNKKMGVLSFSAVESLDRDLVVLTLLAVMGVAKV
uniref:Uncharacterized protein n=2 Tax=Kalmanozyma brasiliensis (strain GHG001) TaxID=1365824 RepID=V5ERK5_KALBG